MFVRVVLERDKVRRPGAPSSAIKEVTELIRECPLVLAEALCLGILVGESILQDYSYKLLW